MSQDIFFLITTKFTCFCTTHITPPALFVALTRCKSRLTIVEITSGPDAPKKSATTAVNFAFNWMRRLGVAQYHPYADAARIGHRDGTAKEDPADAILFGTDESEVQHNADGCKLMRRTVESEEVEEDILTEWVDNAVREFQVGKRPDLVRAAKAHLDVILSRRKASGESHVHTSVFIQPALAHHTYDSLIYICSCSLADQTHLGSRERP